MTELTVEYGRIEKVLEIGIFSSSTDEAVVPIWRGGEIVMEPSEQAWFWTEEWQAGEMASQHDIDAGRVYHFENVDDAIADLGLEEDAGD
jgi:hypothetical protein